MQHGTQWIGKEWLGLCFCMLKRVGMKGGCSNAFEPSDLSLFSIRWLDDLHQRRMGSFIPRGLGVTSLTKSDVNRIQLVKCQENPIIELTCRNLNSVGSDHYLLYNFFHKLHARNLRKLNTMHVTKFGLYFRSVWETTVFVSQILIVASCPPVANSSSLILFF